VSETRFVAFLTPDDRIRHHHSSVKGTITWFAIQYEAFIHRGWHPIVRYDTAHGFAHCDRMHPNGKVDKVALPHWDFNEALTFAEYDIKSNWEVYREQYEKEMRR